VLEDAAGVSAGFGQPVNVAGVKVGTIDAAEVKDGTAHLTLVIDRHELAHVYDNATVALRPITPLKDMSLELAPGGAPGRPLEDGSTIPLSRTTGPVDIHSLLASFDGDTRTYFASLVASLGQGTQNRGPDLRRLLLLLGPTVSQLHQISTEFAGRRRDISQVVHNLAIVVRAAGSDGRLATAVSAGNAALHSVAAQDGSLRLAIRLLPAATTSTRLVLDDAVSFAHDLGPAATSLRPFLQRAPRALRSFATFSAKATIAGAAVCGARTTAVARPRAGDCGSEHEHPPPAPCRPGPELLLQRVGLQPAGQQRGLPVLAGLDGTQHGFGVLGPRRQRGSRPCRADDQLQRSRSGRR
jgi:phospholipid/cholesterol/gamma-HCH transport system substrate-binding protein